MIRRTTSFREIVPFSKSTSIKRVQSLNSIEKKKEDKKTELIYLLSYFLFLRKEDHDFFLQKILEEGIIDKNEILNLYLNDSITFFKKKHQIENDIPYPFQKLKKIGEGGFGEVFHVRHQLDEKEYAIKRMNKEENNSYEIRILSSLEHKNIIRYYSSWNDYQYFYIQMEFCSMNLRDYFYQPERNSNIIEGIMDGLEYLHNKNYIHFDLKPENILINKNDIVKIADFGYSRSVKISNEMNHYYEESLYICSSDILYDNSIDIYSFGIIFLEFFLPFYRTNCERMIHIMKKMKSRDWEMKNEKWNILLDGCLEKNQKHRFSIDKIKYLYKFNF